LFLLLFTVSIQAMNMQALRSFQWLVLLVMLFASPHLGHTQENAKQPSKKKLATPVRTQVLFGGETFLIKEKPAFIMHPDRPASNHESGMPWVFYAPTLAGTPDAHESWMHQQFLQAGIAIAGINVGEAYGSPFAFEYFDALYDEMVRRGFSSRPVYLGRSRGGLWVSSYALHRPERVAAIAGIYPVFDFTTYPGLERAAGAYGLEPENLRDAAEELNPVRRAGELAAAKIPVYIIHGNEDTVVPIEENSLSVAKKYRQSGAGDLITLLRIDGQGHNHWEGFFQCQPLVDFVIEHAR